MHMRNVQFLNVQEEREQLLSFPDIMAFGLQLRNDLSLPLNVALALLDILAGLTIELLECKGFCRHLIRRRCRPYL